MHVLHQGRAEYTLITPGSPAKIERKVSLYRVLPTNPRILHLEGNN